MSCAIKVVDRRRPFQDREGHFTANLAASIPTLGGQGYGLEDGALGESMALAAPLNDQTDSGALPPLGGG